MEGFESVCLNCFSQRGEYDVCPYCGYVAGTRQDPAFLLAPGTWLWGRYIIGTVLGIGGFGVTYKAWDTRLATIVAIKEFYPQNLASRIPGEALVRVFSGEQGESFKTQLDRFLDEAKNMAKFTGDKYIVNVFDFFGENNTAYIVMEYLEGMTLKQYITQSGSLPPEVAVEYGKALLKAVATIHKKGIIHRDISPDNVFVLQNGNIKLLDFGAARFAPKEDENLTIQVVVKKGYAPPEQYRTNMKQGVWTDVYAIGATLYKMLTGITPEESIERSEKDALESPSQLGALCDVAVDKTVLKAMALRPDLRFASADEMLRALEQQTEVRLPEEELKKRKQTRAAVIVLCVALFLGLGGFMAWQAGQEGAPTVRIVQGNSLADMKVEPDTIGIMFSASSYYLETYQALADEFMSRNPDYKIEFHLYNGETEQEAMQRELGQNGDLTLFYQFQQDEEFNGPLEEIAADISLLLASLEVNDYYLLQGYDEYNRYDKAYTMPLGLAFYGLAVDSEAMSRAGLEIPETVDFDWVLNALYSYPGNVYINNFTAARMLCAQHPEVLGGDLSSIEPDAVRFAVGMQQYYYGDTEGRQNFIGESYIEKSGVENSYANFGSNFVFIPFENEGNVVCHAQQVFCISAAASENQQRVAMLFLHFLLSEYGQTKLHIEEGMAFPVNKAVAGHLWEMYPQTRVLTDELLSLPELTKCYYLAPTEFLVAFDEVDYHWGSQQDAIEYGGNWVDEEQVRALIARAQKEIDEAA